MSKKRITITVDPAVVEAGNRAVATGKYSSLSDWANRALVAQTEHDDSMTALSEVIAGWEAEFGVITKEEMEEQARKDREAARKVREEYLAWKAARSA
jgi:Arc/MetJ-type ribon-helix-helix transcriptional regulator